MSELTESRDVLLTLTVKRQVETYTAMDLKTGTYLLSME